MPSPGDELVDIVDSDNRVIAQVTRREMRAKKLPHRCVYILVFNAQGELFIHLRTPHKDINPSAWDLMAGGVPSVGETFEQAAERELAEELGVSTPLEPLFPFFYSDEFTTAHAYVYRTRCDGPFVYQESEVVRGEFVSPADLPQRIATDKCCPDAVAVWHEYAKRYPTNG